LRWRIAQIALFARRAVAVWLTVVVSIIINIVLVFRPLPAALDATRT